MALNTNPASSPLSIVVHSAAGKMGQAVLAQIESDPTLAVGARLSRGDRWNGEGQVVIDFSRPAALLALVPLCERFRIPLVTGTTGLGPAEEEQLARLARSVPVLTAANFSLGLTLLKEALESLVAALPAGFDCEIVESHHRAKVDAPSGTALELAKCVARARKQALESVATWGRHGITGPRGADEIGIHALRLGQVIGRHEVILAGADETLALRHEAHGRQVFVMGAIAAARFLAVAPPGRHELREVLRTSES